MKGQWKAYSNYINGKANYIAGRQLDLDKPLHGGNIEYNGEYSLKAKEVESLCQELNSKED